MGKNKQLDINAYLPQLRQDWEKELFERICKVLEDKGITIQSEDELKHLFQERLKKTVHEGITTLSLDGIEILAYGELHAEFEGTDIKTNYKWAVI